MALTPRRLVLPVLVALAHPAWAQEPPAPAAAVDAGTTPPVADTGADRPEEESRAVGIAGNDKAFELLSDRVVNADSFKVRAQAAVLLGRVGDPRAVPLLIKRLETDEHFVVRSAAATALGSLADDRAAGPLFIAAAEPEPLVRDACVRAITRLDARRNFDMMKAYAREGSPEQRRAAVTRVGDLARTGEPSAVEVVVNALGDEQLVREAASAAVADLSTDRAVPILVGALQHENAGVRAEAARLLGPRRDVGALEALATAYDRAGEQERVRAEIRRSLERLRPLVNQDEIITQARSAPDRHLRARAIRLLGVVGDPRAATALERMLADEDPYIVGTAALALADMSSVQSIQRLEEAARLQTGTRAQAPVDIALRKLRRLREQSR